MIEKSLLSLIIKIASWPIYRYHSQSCRALVHDLHYRSWISLLLHLPGLLESLAASWNHKNIKYEVNIFIWRNLRNPNETSSNTVWHFRRCQILNYRVFLTNDCKWRFLEQFTHQQRAIIYIRTKWTVSYVIAWVSYSQGKINIRNFIKVVWKFKTLPPPFCLKLWDT